MSTSSNVSSQNNLNSSATRLSNMQTASSILQGSSGVLSGLMGLVNAGNNYRTQMASNTSLLLQADEVELKAKEAINNSWSEFNSAIGNIDYQSMRSGVRNTSGSIRNNIEKSAVNLGKDNNKISRYAANEATSMRAQYQINRYLAKAGMKQEQANSLTSMGFGLATMGIGLL